MRYRLAIFDFDGTLADSFPPFLAAVNEAADRYRFRRIPGPRHAALIGQYRGDVSLFGKRRVPGQVVRTGRVAPGEAIAIGDELRDLAAAPAAHGPDERFHRVEEIAERLG